MLACAGEARLHSDRRSCSVTGASGGVGSMSIALLAKAGWHVVASTGRVTESGVFKDLGAAEIADRTELSGSGKPPAKERWAAGIDSVGSATLANLLLIFSTVVRCCLRMAGGMDSSTSVAPFILRNVALLGIDSVKARKVSRLKRGTVSLAISTTTSPRRQRVRRSHSPK